MSSLVLTMDRRTVYRILPDPISFMHYDLDRRLVSATPFEPRFLIRELSAAIDVARSVDRDRPLESSVDNAAALRLRSTAVSVLELRLDSFRFSHLRSYPFSYPLTSPGNTRYNQWPFGGSLLIPG